MAVVGILGPAGNAAVAALKAANAVHPAGNANEAAAQLKAAENLLSNERARIRENNFYRNGIDSTDPQMVGKFAKAISGNLTKTLNPKKFCSELEIKKARSHLLQ